MGPQNSAVLLSIKVKWGFFDELQPKTKDCITPKKPKWRFYRCTEGAMTKVGTDDFINALEGAAWATWVACKL